MAEVFFGTASSWMDLLTEVEKMFGADSPEWQALQSKTITQAEFNKVVKQLPYVDTVTNQNGDVIQYRVWSNYERSVWAEGGNVPSSYEGAAETVHELNSNAETSTVVKTQIPVNTTPTTDPQTQQQVITVEKGAKVATAGGATATAFAYKDKIIPALYAVGILATLGKITKPELYEELPRFFDLNNIKDHDVDKWKEFTTDLDEITGLQVINDSDPSFDPDNPKSTMYIPADAFLYLTKYLNDNHVFETGGTTEVDEPQTIQSVDLTDYFDTPIIAGTLITTQARNDNNRYTIDILQSGAFCIGYDNTGHATYPEAPYGGLICADSDDVLVSETIYNTQTQQETTQTKHYSLMRSFTYGGSTVYYTILSGQQNMSSNAPIQNTKATFPPTNGNNVLAWNIVYGGVPLGNIEGIEQEPGATTPTFTAGMTYDQLKQLLETTYPDLANKKIVQQVVQPDGSIKEIEYYPVVMPEPNDNPTEGMKPEEQPISGTQRQADTEVDPENTPEVIIKYLYEDAVQPRNPVDENTGEGTTPPVVIPTGSASALYTVYNPTEGEIQSFGSWLWSANFVDQLLKMFNDPMQAIISLHKVFCTPATSGRNDIKVGYLNSGVQANVVSSQYVDVNLGSVSLNEDYRNVFDYPPYTEVSIYLPFVGFVRLDVNDVMRSAINVTYHIDVLTGACLAEVKVTRDSFGGTLYQYAGDCSVHYPLSSGSYMGIVGALLGVAGTIASGGALAPMALGVAGGVMGARSSVERSGGLSGNAGAMGIKKPYLVIQRPQTNMPLDFEAFLGKPSYSKVKISECSGFIKCTEVHALNTPATESELNELIALLKEGVIL